MRLEFLMGHMEAPPGGSLAPQLYLSWGMTLPKPDLSRRRGVWLDLP